MGLCLNNFPSRKRRVSLFLHTHTTKTKRTIKIKNPKNSIEKAKRRGKIKPTRK
jgi:hypothetical protein